MRTAELIKKLGARCLACNTTRNLSIDHITSRKLGGKDALANYQVLCRPCNTSKGMHVVRFADGVPDWFKVRLSLKCPVCLKMKAGYRVTTDDFVCRLCGHKWNK